MNVPPIHLSNWAMVGLNVVAWGTIHASTGYLAHQLPETLCERDTWLTTLRGWEQSGRMWRVLRVHDWKDRLPEAGDVFEGGVSKRSLPSFDDAGLQQFAASTRRAEIGHWSAAACSPIFLIWNPLWISGVLVLYGLVVNAPFIAIQRYNRLRVSRVLARRASRRAASARRAADTTGNSIPYGSPPRV